MFRFTSSLFLMFSIIGLAAAGVTAQIGAENHGLGFGRRAEDMPKSIREAHEKMRIDRETKEYAELIERGQDAVRLAERLEFAYTANGRLSDMDLANLESVEKNMKKIRSGMGGDDDDEKVDNILGKKQLSIRNAISTLRETTATLLQELKKTSRFSISASAIQTSNAAIKIARFIRFGK